MRILAIIGLAAVLVAATGAQAQERLVLGPYPGTPPWRQITNQAEGPGWIRELAPSNRPGPDYPDIVTAQTFPQAKGVDPSTMLRRIFGAAQGACEQVKVNGPTPRREGGLPVAYAQVYCSRQNGKTFGVVEFFKVIGGRDADYAINRDMRVPASDVAGAIAFPKGQEAAMRAMVQAQAAADRYLTQSVYVCGGASTDPRCKSR
jgi:hypothetical protein